MAEAEKGEREEARGLVEWAKRQAVELLVRDRRHCSVVVASAPGGRRSVADVTGLPGWAVWAAARAFLAAAGAHGYVMVHEAWVRKAAPEDFEVLAGWDEPGRSVLRRRPGVPTPSEHPDRREALVVQWQFRLPGGAEWSGLWQQMFRRGPVGEVVLEEAEDFRDDEGGRWRGRGARLLDPPGPDPEAAPPGLGNLRGRG